MRVEHIGDATLYLGDCLTLLHSEPTVLCTSERLSDSYEIVYDGEQRAIYDRRPGMCEMSVVVTDPPYGIRHSTSHGATWANTSIQGDSDTTTRDRAFEGYLNVAAFGSWKTPPIDDCRTVLVWDKGPAFGMGDLSMPWKPSFELIYIRGSIWTGRRDEGVLRGDVMVSWESKGRRHPHQKPVGIVGQIISKVPKEAVVIDPFMGSGTTGVACVNLGRKFIGIEIEEKYFDIACERIRDAYKQPRLFDDEQKVAVQGDMFEEAKT